MPVRCRFALVVLAGVSACATDYPKIARENFSRDRSCPLDGVVATPRPDLSWYDLTFKPKPSSEIAADPARLRLWEAEEEKSRVAANKRVTVHLVTGCKEKHYYACGSGKSGPYCSPMTNDVP